MNHQSLIDNLKSLQEPVEEFKGSNGILSKMPKEIQVFSGEKLIHQSVKIHHRFVMVLCLNGEGTMIINENTYHITPGWGKMVFPHQCHAYADMDEKIDWLYITFEMDCEQDLLSLKDYPFEISDGQFNLIEQIVDCYAEVRESDSNESQVLVLLLTELLGSIMNTCVQSKSSFMDHLNKQSLSQKTRVVSLINRFVYENVANSIQIQDIVEYLQKSDSYVRKIVREVLRIGVGELIQRTQIYKSIYLLKFSDETVTQVATACGFQSVQSFSRAFSRKMKYSPLEYRKKFLQVY